MDSGNYEGAIHSLERARQQVRPYPNQSLFVVSLVSFLTHLSQHTNLAHCLSQVSGWNFDALDIKIRQCLCEALYAADRIEHAVEYFHQLASELGEGTSSGNEYSQWAHGE